MLETASLLGYEPSHVVKDENGHYLSSELKPALLDLIQAARERGFEIAIASAYRSFDRQLKIWNEKAEGVRPIFDDNGNSVDIGSLSERELMMAILRWSALPGASRHHWGTDFDIYDAAALRPGQKLELNLAETQPGGPFFNMYCWLDEYLDEEQVFFRPYRRDMGGVATEPWHLSYRPLAEGYLESLDVSVLSHHLDSQPIALKQTILSSIDEIYERFICNICLN